MLLRNGASSALQCLTSSSTSLSSRSAIAPSVSVSIANGHFPSALQQQRRGYMPKGYYFPFSARMDDDEFFMPPPSERPLYTNLFDQADNPKLYELEERNTLKHPDVKPTDDIAQYPMSVIDPHRLEWAHIAPETMYYQFFENTFPKQPDLSKGELAVGAQSTRTSVWHTPGEPAIKSIARFEPANFQAVGYAENNFIPTSSPPDYYPQIDEMRLEPGHADRRPIYYLAQAGMIAFLAANVRHALYWAINQYMTMEPGMQWPKPVEVRYKHLQPGEQMNVTAGGQSVFIRRRTDAEIRAARADDHMANELRDPETDVERCPDPEWLICSGVCTHLGCTPNRGGAYGGWLCPCHGSHYDTSGRIRAGPAPKNLPIIHHEPIDEETILLGEPVPTERRWT